ncbi:MAG: tripartite tricarboxylate transporter TctB family protein [Deltaproteobacteria bacterium]|nr:tripartite tricarboxylate transporter TctB family protein [Deltaproteobacteria bacterium]
MKFSFRHLFNIGIVVIMAMVVITAWGYDEQTRLLPLIVSVPVLIMAVILTIQEFRESLRKGAEKKEKEEAGESVFAKEVNISIWVVAMFISLYLFGFILTTFFFTFLSLKVRSRFSWVSSLGVSVGCLAFLYLVLITALNVDLYQGAVTIALRKAFLGY